MAQRELLCREVGFSDAATKKFVADARYPGGPRQALTESGSEGLAWGANKVKLSRGAGKGGMALLAAVMLIFDSRRSDAAFKKAIAEFQKKSGQPVEVKK